MSTRPSQQVTSEEWYAIGKELLIQWARLFRNLQFHNQDNEVFNTPIEALIELSEKFFEHQETCQIEASGRELFINDIRIRQDLAHLNSYHLFIQELSRRKLGGLLLTTVPDRSLIQGFLRVFHTFSPSEQQLPEEYFQTLLRQEHIEGIECLPMLNKQDNLGVQSKDRRERAINTYEQALNFIRESISTLDSPEQLNVNRAKRLVHQIVELSFEEGQGFSLAGLATIRNHDEYTFNHMVNVCVLAVAFGQRLGLNRHQLAELGLCALYHDIGKMFIPLEILNKHKQFTEEEWATMGNHTIYAARTLLVSENFDYTSVQRILTAMQHHLRYDGSGYPKLKLFKQQTLYTRITAIVDTYDAMTTQRIYQRKHLPNEAMEVLVEHSGTRYDPLLVKAFVNCMGIFPVGCLALMSNGSLAVVVETHRDASLMYRPHIKVITDPTQNMLDPIPIDLSQRDPAQLFISKIVDPDEYNINISHFAF